MADISISTLGRFSSQMLTYLGTQRTVEKVAGGIAGNTFKYGSSSTVFPAPGSVLQATAGQGVPGSYSPAVYNSVTSFYLSRGASQVYADTMTALTIDTAAILGITPADFLIQSEINGQMVLKDDGYTAINMLRDPGNQIGTSTPVSNRDSLVASQIRS
jgi:hypothetical protein